MDKEGKSSLKNYHILKDPHMIYYIQTPTRLLHLLNCGKYELEGNKIIDSKSLDSF